MVCLVRSLLIRNLGADSHISWPGNRDPQPPIRPFLTRKSCSLDRGGWMTPRGGCRPTDPPRSRKIFLIFDLRNFGLSARLRLKKLSVWARLAGFLSNRATCKTDPDTLERAEGLDFRHRFWTRLQQVSALNVEITALLVGTVGSALQNYPQLTSRELRRTSWSHCLNTSIV